MAIIKKLWNGSAPLTAVGLLMLLALVLSIAAMIIDQRVITGALAWLKPAKFAISSALYALTLAWLLIYLKVWSKLVRAMAWLTALVLVLEVGIIDIQAARGVASHFNVGTKLDAWLYGVMGFSIAVLWLAGVVIALALFRQPFENRAFGRALRFGMLITVLGASIGGLMTRPTSEQLRTARSTGSIPVVGAHTVGAPDGGPGLPGTAWSTHHGDLRVAHFLGLHGLQLLPLLGLLILNLRIPENRQARLVTVAGMSYLSLIVILVWQALRGQSLVQPDLLTLTVLAFWLLATVIGGLTANRAVHVVAANHAGPR